MTKKTETRTCVKCSNDYEPEYYDILGAKLLKGKGLCIPCRKIELAEMEAKEKAAEQARIMKARKGARERSGIPFKFMTQDFSTFEKGYQDRALKLCWDYAEKYPVDKRPVGYPSLYLWSTDTWGTGKTHLSCAILHRILDRWEGGESRCPRVVFVSEPDHLREIQATYSFDSEEKKIRESEDDIIRRIISADLVVLDDVGKEPRRDMQFVRKQLFAIVNGRDYAHLPLIITANLSPDGLKNHMDEPPTEASFNRFYAMIRGKYIRMEGKSYRRK